MTLLDRSVIEIPNWQKLNEVQCRKGTTTFYLNPDVYKSLDSVVKWAQSQNEPYTIVKQPPPEKNFNRWTSCTLNLKDGSYVGVLNWDYVNSPSEASIVCKSRTTGEKVTFDPNVFTTSSSIIQWAQPREDAGATIF